METEDKREKLKQYYFLIKGCSKCNLAQTRTNFVFGSGNANSKILFVGEAPGKNEDLQGKPFVGPAGKLLDELLSIINLTRNEVFIANVLKCRPPQNRDPKLEEIDVCKNYLFKQIEIINPIIICTLGKYSTQLLLNTDEGITGLRGRVFKIDGRYILPINHPAAALYTPSRFEILKLDFKRISKVIKIIESGCDDASITVEYDYGFQKNISKSNVINDDNKNINKNDKNDDSSATQLGLF
ncbi:MAG: uracil-DNA glycosylase [Actinobacteria bacterium]|nr:uracil-DNA glycosylase [Cyanobacteriota bacterium]MCL5771018.1 uracil-DNA glycosylase [Actinomycetota bacterium]